MLRRLPQNGGFLLSAILILASLTVLLTSYPASIPTWAASGLLGGTQDEPRSTRIHLFIPMTKDAAMSNKRFCRGVESAIVNGWEPIVFNWDSDHPQPKKNKVYSESPSPLCSRLTYAWPGWHALLSSPAHTQNISGDDLVFLMDGMDAWLQLSPDIMARRYEEYDGKIMVGADKNFWPEQVSDYPPEKVATLTRLRVRSMVSFPNHLSLLGCTTRRMKRTTLSSNHSFACAP